MPFHADPHTQDLGTPVQPELRGRLSFFRLKPPEKSFLIRCIALTNTRIPDFSGCPDPIEGWCDQPLNPGQKAAIAIHIHREGSLQPADVGLCGEKCDLKARKHGRHGGKVFYFRPARPTFGVENYQQSRRTEPGGGLDGLSGQGLHSRQGHGVARRNPSNRLRDLCVCQNNMEGRLTVRSTGPSIPFAFSSQP